MKPRVLASVATAITVAVALSFLLLALSPCGHQPAAPVSNTPVAQQPRIDVHTHLSVGSLPVLLELMDRYGVEHAVDLSGGTPDTSLEAHLQQARASGGRISVFMTLPGRELQRPNYGPRIASMLARAKDMGVKGLKISKGLGLGYVNEQGVLVPVDDPGLDPVFEACATLGLPVSIHTADPKAFWQPPDSSNERYEELQVHPGWSFYGQPVPTWDALMGQLERRIARHPNTTFISVHFGNAAEEPERVERMLRTYPNLYIDTAARIPEFGRHPSPRMRKLFIDYQDRILYGTDLGVGREAWELMLGSTGAQPPTPEDVRQFFESSYAYFETNNQAIPSPTPIQGRWSVHGLGLPRDVLRKLYRDNAVKLLGLSKTGEK